MLTTIGFRVGGCGNGGKKILLQLEAGSWAQFQSTMSKIHNNERNMFWIVLYESWQDEEHSPHAQIKTNTKNRSHQIEDNRKQNTEIREQTWINVISETANRKLEHQNSRTKIWFSIFAFQTWHGGVGWCTRLYQIPLECTSGTNWMWSIMATLLHPLCCRAALCKHRRRKAKKETACRVHFSEIWRIQANHHTPPCQVWNAKIENQNWFLEFWCSNFRFAVSEITLTCFAIWLGAGWMIWGTCSTDNYAPYY
jgi:hypothetical protein